MEAQNHEALSQKEFAKHCHPDRRFRADFHRGSRPRAGQQLETGGIQCGNYGHRRDCFGFGPGFGSRRFQRQKLTLFPAATQHHSTPVSQCI